MVLRGCFGFGAWFGSVLVPWSCVPYLSCTSNPQTRRCVACATAGTLLCRVHSTVYRLQRYRDRETFFSHSARASRHGARVCVSAVARSGNEKIKKPARLSQTSLCACLFSYYGCTPLFSLLALALGAKKHTYYEQRLTTRARAARGISASSTCSQHFAVLPGVVTRC